MRATLPQLQGRIFFLARVWFFVCEDPMWSPLPPALHPWAPPDHNLVQRSCNPCNLMTRNHDDTVDRQLVMMRIMVQGFMQGTSNLYYGSVKSSLSDALNGPDGEQLQRASICLMLFSQAAVHSACMLLVTDIMGRVQSLEPRCLMCLVVFCLRLHVAPAEHVCKRVRTSWFWVGDGSRKRAGK